MAALTEELRVLLHEKDTNSKADAQHVKKIMNIHDYMVKGTISDRLGLR